MIILEIDIPEGVIGDHALQVLISSKGSESSDTPCKHEVIVNLQIVANSTSDNTIGTNELLESDYLIPLIILIVVAMAAITAAVMATLKMKHREVELLSP